MSNSKQNQRETVTLVLGEYWAVSPDTERNITSFRLVRHQANHLMAEGYEPNNLSVIRDEHPKHSQ